LADPAPILHTLMTDRLLGVRYRLDGVITTVDAATGQATLDRQIESVKQAAVADRLLLTKTDLVDPQEIAALIQRLRALNPAAPILQAVTAATIRPRCGGRLNWGDWTAEPRPDPIMVRLGKVAASRRSRPGIHSHCRYPPPTHRSDCSDESRHLWHGLPDSPS
jgi:hypothetical protein